MVPLKIFVLSASILACSTAIAEAAEPAGAEAGKGEAPRTAGASAAAAWPVATSLKVTLRNWAQRKGWPAPQFLTEADWVVDVPGVIPGSIEVALRILAEGFGGASSRPRIQVSANHVIVVSEIGAE